MTDNGMHQEFDEIAETLYALFRAEPIPCMVNGKEGAAVFFAKDAQIAQVKVILRAATERALEPVRDLPEVWKRFYGNLPDGEYEGLGELRPLMSVISRALAAQPEEKSK